MNDCFYDDPTAAFDNAIEQKNLSADPYDDRYAGRYMYMHSTWEVVPDGQIIDHFKNIDTRAYDVVSTRKKLSESQWNPSNTNGYYYVDDVDLGKCVLCGGFIGEWGNNPYPLAEKGECCNTCNTERVVPERLRLT
jgi:hypothetical protein